MKNIIRAWWDLRLPVAITGRHSGKTIWLDFATLRDVEITNCKLVYFGIGGLSAEGSISITHCRFDIKSRRGVARDLLDLAHKRGRWAAFPG